REWLPNRKEFGQSAEDDLLEAVRLEPDNNVFRAWSANFDPESGQKAEILKRFNNPKTSLEFYALGINHLWLDGDVSPFNEAIKLEPEFLLAYFERGMLFGDGPENPQGAFDDMTTVIAKLPKDNLIKGIAYYVRASMGNPVSAANNLKKDSASVIRDFSRAI